MLFDPTTFGGTKTVKISAVKNNYGSNSEDLIAEQTRTGYVAPASVPMTYDQDGNLTDDAHWHYTWDAENRLIQIETAPAAIAVGVARQKLEFVYDAQGRRVSKKVSNWISGAYVVASQTLFVYDGWNMVAELNALSSNAVVRTYVWGVDLSGTSQGAGGVGGLLVASDTTSSHFVAYDGNGNVAAYVSANTGNTSAAYEYNAFGETLVANGTAQSTFPFRFSTKYTESETSLLYYGLRFYDPIAGRWLSRDPIEENGGSNLHGFIDNDSINYFDNGGLRKDSSRNSYWRMWKKQNPNRDKTKDPQRQKTLNRGCVGITCLNLGQPGMPDTSNCYRARAQAEARRAEMKKGCACSGSSPNKTPAEPRLFSIHLWNDTGRDGTNPDVTFDDAGKADLSNWDLRPRPGDEWVNFDYGFVNDSGTIQHANHLHDPGGRSGRMKVYESSETEWQRSYSDFNTEVWCVSCNKDRF